MNIYINKNQLYIQPILEYVYYLKHVFAITLKIKNRIIIGTVKLKRLCPRLAIVIV